MSSSILNIIDDVILFRSTPVIKLVKGNTTTEDGNLKDFFNLMADMMSDKEYSLSLIRDAIDEIEDNPVDEDIETSADYIREKNLEKIQKFTDKYITGISGFENITIDGIDMYQSITAGVNTGFEAVGDNVYYYGSKENSTIIGTVLNPLMYSEFEDWTRYFESDLSTILSFIDNCDDIF